MPRSLSILAAIWLALAAAGAVLLSGSAAANAHPLGNFTINHYTRIDVSDSGVELYRVLEMAEIATVQERQAIDANNDGQVDEPERAVYAASKASELEDGLTLRIDGEPVDLVASERELTFPRGEGGLPLLRLIVTYRADVPEGWQDASPGVAFEDRNYGDRLGWREVIVRGGPGVELIGSTAPATDISSELRAYPEGSLSSPLDVRAATFDVRPGAGAPLTERRTQQVEAVRGNPNGVLSRFSDLIARDELTPGVVIVALLAAVAFGAYHALTPGHGKTIVAAYLVGSRGTAWHALLLGLVVTATHTSTVYLVGFVALYLSQYIVPEDLYPWLGLASGALILAMGVTLLVARLRASGLLREAAARARRLAPRRRHLAFAGESGALALAPQAHDYDTHSHHDHTDHSHSHINATAAHSHGFGSMHSHRVPGQDGESVTLRSLVGLGVFGGMIPCPSAIVVMLSAIALHRVAFGLVLIVAFSVGLAGVLVAIGFALVFARSITERVPILATLAGSAAHGGWQAKLVRAVPVGGAGAVVVAGAVITLRAMSQQGWL